MRTRYLQLMETLRISSRLVFDDQWLYHEVLNPFCASALRLWPAASNDVPLIEKKMSNQQLEERHEKEQNQRLADYLGLTIDEVETLAPDIDTNASDDGLAYGYVLTFHRDSPGELLAKVKGLHPGSLSMQLDLSVLDHPDDEE